ncbi:MAG: FISUMP domain-containing protein [Bacteroidales bacterium]|jgi:uncharacterized protein (TIGR02145 family)|nr:FISUMP domain-containing protein [Bacteroidales bacterium]
MKRLLLSAILVVSCLMLVIAQKPSIELTFTATENSTYKQLDSIRVINRSQDCDTLLIFPDTTLVLDYIVGVNEEVHHGTSLVISQNYPNPVANSTSIEVFIPDKGRLEYVISDLKGRILIKSELVLEQGLHIFNYTPGLGEMSFFTASFSNKRESIKVIHSKQANRTNASLEYSGMKNYAMPGHKSYTAANNFHFELGDELTYIGYTSDFESGLPDTPSIDDTIVFQFAYDIPCPGMPTITYEGKVYNTVQIFSQCWLKQNLNVGTMINIKQAPQDNGIIEKHCYAGIAANCGEYGGLYAWHEMMDYYPYPGSQGICPEGWHIPTDEEFKILEAVADSLYNIGDSIWDQHGFNRGYDAGYNLKSSEGWHEDGNGSDKYGFSGNPGGVIWWEPVYGNVYWQGIGKYGHYYTSNQHTYNYEGWYHEIAFFLNSVGRTYNILPTAFSVRCLRDY